MKQIGLQKAADKLRRASQALDRIKKNHISGDTFETFIDDDWSLFLESLNSAYEVLLATSRKSSSQNMQWFGSKPKKTVKNDSLLRYLRAARGSDFHGIEKITKTTQKIDYAAPNQPPPAISFHVKTNTGETVVLGGPESEWITLTNPEVKLIPIVDQYSTEFKLPATHLGDDLEDKTLVALAEAGLRYYLSLLSDCESLS